jgi:5-methylcytosine-specific restriction endonuclease McrA
LSVADQCYYCEITIDEIIELINKRKIFKKNERGWKMEIDRKEPNQEYSDENCVPACYWCNNAKTDEFNAEEFKLIGEAIGKVLRARK